MNDKDRLLLRCEGIPISLNKTCEILKIGKLKARKLLGTKVRRLETDNNQYGYNLADVLRII